MSKTKTKTETKTGANLLLAQIDADAPAKVKRTTKDVLAHMARFEATREPDVFDEVTAEAAWLGEDIVVVVDLERLDEFRRWVSCHGMMRTESYRVVRLTDKDWGWRDVFEAVGARVSA